MCVKLDQNMRKSERSNRLALFAYGPWSATTIFCHPIFTPCQHT